MADWKRRQLHYTLQRYVHNDKLKPVVQQAFKWLAEHPKATLTDLEKQERAWAAAILPITQPYIPTLTPEQVAKMIAERSQP